jgi:hypothetical protein
MAANRTPGSRLPLPSEAMPGHGHSILPSPQHFIFFLKKKKSFWNKINNAPKPNTRSGLSGVLEWKAPKVAILGFPVYSHGGPVAEGTGR